MAADSMAGILWAAQSHFLDAVLYNTPFLTLMHEIPATHYSTPVTSFGILIYCERLSIPCDGYWHCIAASSR